MCIKRRLKDYGSSILKKSDSIDVRCNMAHYSILLPLQLRPHRVIASPNSEISFYHNDYNALPKDMLDTINSMGEGLCNVTVLKNVLFSHQQTKAKCKCSYD